MTTVLNDRSVKVRANGFILSDSLAWIRYVSEPDRKIVLEFTPPLEVDKTMYTHAVITPRLERDDVSTLLVKGLLGCAVTWIPKERFESTKPFDLSWWRGGGAAITDVELIRGVS
jgi:hypothetical protein